MCIVCKRYFEFVAKCTSVITFVGLFEHFVMTSAGLSCEEMLGQPLLAFWINSST